MTNALRQLFPHSEQVGQKVARKSREKKYPFDTVGVGESFVIYHKEMTAKSVKTYVSRMGIKLGRRFVIVDHGEETGYEIARVE